MNEVKVPDNNHLASEARTDGSATAASRLHVFGRALLEPRRLIVFAIPLTMGFGAAAQSLDRAFDEDLNKRPFVAQTIATIERTCANVHGPSEIEESACAWPKLAREALAQLDLFEGRGPFARTARFTGAGRDLAERLVAGPEQETAQLAGLLKYLQTGRDLNERATALRKALNSPSWKLSRALGGEADPGAEVRDITAWLSSDNPLGFLKRADKAAYDRAVACLTPPDVAAAIASPAGILTRERLTFQEVDVKRAAWGDVVPGMISNAGAPADALGTLTELQTRIGDLDLSGLGSESDKCRALSRVQQALGAADIESTRLECVRAQADGFALPARADDRLAFGQKALLLLESRRATAGADSIRRQRSAAVYRDLARASSVSCDPDPRWSPVLKDLKRFINNESLED